MASIWTEEYTNHLRGEWDSRGGRLAADLDRELAEKFGCSEGAVRRKRLRMGLTVDAALNHLEDEEDDEEDYRAEIAALKAQVVKKKGDRKRKKKNEEAMRVDLVEELIRDAVTLIDKRPIIIAPRPQEMGNGHEQEAMVLISDVQIGEWVDAEAVGGLASYDMDIFRERANRLKIKVEKILRLHQSTHPIHKLHVMFNGDMVEGHGIFQGQPYELDASVVDQTISGADVFHRVIAHWSGLVDEIAVSGVYGNHGKVGYDAPVKDNWDYILYRFLEQLGRIDGLNNVTYNFPRAWWQVVSSMDHGFLLVHGDDIKGSTGIPFYGAEKAEGRLRGMIPEPFEYLLIGHHHRYCTFETNLGEIIFNGAWPGGSTYSLKKMQLTSRPSQLMWGVDKRHGKTWVYRLYLDRD